MSGIFWDDDNADDDSVRVLHDKIDILWQLVDLGLFTTCEN